MDYKLEKYLNKLQNIEYDRSHPSYSIYMEKYMYYLTGGRGKVRGIQSIFNKFINMMKQQDLSYINNMNNNDEKITDDFNWYIENVINKNRQQKILLQTDDEIDRLIVNYHILYKEAHQRPQRSPRPQGPPGPSMQTPQQMQQRMQQRMQQNEMRKLQQGMRRQQPQRQGSPGQPRPPGPPPRQRAPLPQFN